MKEFQEGKAVFRANLSGKDKGPGKAKGVFYNPAMELSRDLHVAFAKKLDFSGLLLDGLAASGIRGIRLALEANFNVEFCDTSILATETIATNLELNGIKSKIHNLPVEELLFKTKYDGITESTFLSIISQPKRVAWALSSSIISGPLMPSGYPGKFSTSLVNIN